MAGMAAVIIFFALAIVSTIQYQGLPLLNTQWLDDPGNTNLNPNGAAYFSTACILSGLLLTIFYAGLLRWYGDDAIQNILVMAGQLSGMASGIALIMSGLRPALYGPEHYLWSTVFLGATALALLFISAALLNHIDYSKLVLAIGILAMTMCMLGLIIRLLSLNAGIADLIAVALAFAWIGALSWNTYSQFAGEGTVLGVAC